MPYSPKTGAKCPCKPGVQRDNCPDCEGSGWVIDFKAIHARREANAPVLHFDPDCHACHGTGSKTSVAISPGFTVAEACDECGPIAAALRQAALDHPREE